MKKVFAANLTVLICLLTALTGCNAYGDPKKRTVYAMDTVMVLSAYGDASVIDGAADIVYDLEKKLSVTDTASEIYELNSTGTAELSQTALNIVSGAIGLCSQTAGALDISVYPAVKAWGFTTGNYRVPDNEELNALLPLVDYNKINVHGNTVSLDYGMQIDLGAVAKGYASDKIAKYFRQNDVKSGIINLGGNVKTIEKKPDGSTWKVAITAPKGGYFGILSTFDKAVITSGSYERYFVEDGKTYCHIIDPSTCKTVDNGLASVTVIAESGFYCDALSTALFVMGKENAANYYKAHGGFDLIMIDSDDNVTLTSGIHNDFTLYGEYKNAKVTVI